MRAEERRRGKESGEIIVKGEDGKVGRNGKNIDNKGQNQQVKGRSAHRLMTCAPSRKARSTAAMTISSPVLSVAQENTLYAPAAAHVTGIKQERGEHEM